jgi:hypothetical protein
MNNVFDHEKIKKRMRELEDFDADPKGEPIVMWHLRNSELINDTWLSVDQWGRCYVNGIGFAFTPQYIIAKWKIYPK